MESWPANPDYYTADQLRAYGQQCAATRRTVTDADVKRAMEASVPGAEPWKVFNFLGMVDNSCHPVIRAALESYAANRPAEVGGDGVEAERVRWFKRAGDYLIRAQRYEAVLKACRSELAESLENEGRHSGMAELIRRIDAALTPPAPVSEVRP